MKPNFLEKLLPLGLIALVVGFGLDVIANAPSWLNFMKGMLIGMSVPLNIMAVVMLTRKMKTK